MGKQPMRQEQHCVSSANLKGTLRPSARLLEHLRACSWLNELHDAATAWTPTHALGTGSPASGFEYCRDSGVTLFAVKTEAFPVDSRSSVSDPEYSAEMLLHQIFRNIQG